MYKFEIDDILNDIDSAAVESGVIIRRQLARELIIENSESDLESLAVYVIDSAA